MCDVRTKCLCREGVLFTLPVDFLGSEICRQAKNNHLNKRKIVSESLLVWRGATGFPVPISTLQILLFSHRLTIANDPNLGSTSIHRSAATARMKTNFLKGNISIQFEGEPCRRTPGDLQIVVENLFFLIALDGLSSTFNMFFEKSTISALRFTEIRLLS